MCYKGCKLAGKHLGTLPHTTKSGSDSVVSINASRNTIKVSPMQCYRGAPTSESCSLLPAKLLQVTRNAHIELNISYCWWPYCCVPLVANDTLLERRVLRD